MYLENNQIKRYPLLMVLAWSVVIAWMGLIFYLSHQPAEQSGQLSSLIADGILRLIGRGGNPDLLAAFNGAIRVIAHGTAFFVLALLVGIAFHQVYVIDIPNAVVTLIFCLLYAATDEWHQSIVPGRSSEWADFFTDAAGIIIAIVILQIYWAVKRVNAVLSVDR